MVDHLIADPPPPPDPKKLARLKRPGGEKYPKAQHDPKRPIALRTHVEPPDWIPTSGSWFLPTPWTALLIGSISWDAPDEPLRTGMPKLVTPYGTAETWTYHPDDAAADEIRVIADWCDERGIGEPIDRAEAAEYLLYRLFFKQRCALVAWDPKLEIARLSVDWGIATGFFRGGYSFITNTYNGEPTSKNPELANGEIEDRYRPRLLVRPIDSVRALRGVPAPDDADFPDRGGWRVVVSIRALVEAQAGKPLILSEACDLYGVKRPRTAEGLDGLAAEMETLEALYRKAMTLHRKLLPQKPPNPAMSPGTYAQGLLEQQGLVPPMARQRNVDRGMLAAWMGSLYSGDVGLGVRGPHIPIRYLDMSGAYAMAAIHSGVFELLSAKRLHHYQRDPDQTLEYLMRVAKRIRRWLDGKTDRCPLTPKDWRRLARTLVYVIPNGDLLPHRFKWKDTWRMTVAPLSGDTPLPFVLADVLISILRTGQIPEITRAIRVAQWGQQHRSPVTLPTGTVIGQDDDPFAVMANDRARLEVEGGPDLARGMLKGMTNALASGKTAQFLDDEPTTKPREQQIWNPLDPQAEPELKRFSVIEEPGVWYCPQAAAGVTATARLLLTLSRLAFETAGGTIAYWDTDSLLVIATPSGSKRSPPTRLNSDPRSTPGTRTPDYRSTCRNPGSFGSKPRTIRPEQPGSPPTASTLRSHQRNATTLTSCTGPDRTTK